MTKRYLGRLSEKIYKTLLNEIGTGKYEENSRFPTEKELCKRFNCSHNTVRKALAELIRANILETRQGSGSYVKRSIHDQGVQNSIISVMYMGNLDLLTDIQDYTMQQNCTLTVYSQIRTRWSTSKELQFYEQLNQQKHKALLAFCSPYPSQKNDKMLLDLEKNGIRVIHYEHNKLDLPTGNYILPDYRLCGYIGATTLMVSGYDIIMYGGFDKDAPFAELQEHGFFQALKEHRGVTEKVDFDQHGLELANSYKIPRMGIESDANKRLKMLVDSIGNQKIGIFCNTVDRACVLLDAFEKEGLDIGKQVGLIGTELLNSSTENIKRLDTMSFPRKEIFFKAIDQAISPTFSGLHELIAPKLNKRGLTLC